MVFRIVQPDYAGQVTTTLASVFRLNPQTDPITGALFQLAERDTVPNAIAGTNTAGTVTATLATNLQVEIVFYQGESYRPDSFTYDRETGELSFLSSDPATSGVISFLTPGGITSLRTTTINKVIPKLFRDWKVLSFEKTTSFEDFPTLTFNFRVVKSREAEVAEAFCAGTEIVAEGRWRVVDAEITETDSNLLQVEVSAISLWAPYNNASRSELDIPIGLKQGNVKERELASFAAAAGVRYVGPSITRRIPSDTSTQEWTTFRRELEEKAEVARGFVFYDDPNQVEIRVFGRQATHYIRDEDVLDIRASPITKNAPGAGPEVDGVKLTDELRNAVVTLDFDPDAIPNAPNGEPGAIEGLLGGQGQYCLYEFINCFSEFDAALPVELKNFELVQPPAERLRVTSLNFDQGALTKSVIKTTFKGGVALQEEVSVYGYTYSSIDTHVISGENNNIITFDNSLTPANYWGLVSNYVQPSVFAPETRYLIRKFAYGNQSARLRQETDANEAVNLYAQALQAGLIPSNPAASPAEALNLFNQSQAYVFNQNLPVNEEIDYNLRNFADFYSDIEIPDPEQDPLFVQPKFYEQKLTNRRDEILVENPDSSEALTLPPLTIQSLKQELETVRVTSTGDPERIRRRVDSLDQEGPNGINTIKLSTTRDSVGRPGVHTRLESETLEDEPQNSNINQSILNVAQFGGFRFWLETEGAESDFEYIETELGYEGIDDPEQVRVGAETRYAILNSQNARPVEFSIRWRDGIVTGDTVFFRGDKYIVFDASDRRIPEAPGKQKGQIDLTLGRFVSPSVILIQESTT